MAAQVAWSEALMAMIAMLIVLGFVLFYYCIWPLYRGFMKRKERERELYENDPRWDNAKFNFQPRRPKDYESDKKYSRLAACSRTSSMRSNAQLLPDAAPGSSQEDVFCPPMYSELFETSSSLGTPPSYKSKPSSVENSNVDLLGASAGEAPTAIVVVPTKPAKIRKPKKKPPPATEPLADLKESNAE